MSMYTKIVYEVVLVLTFLPTIFTLSCSNSIPLNGSSCVFNFNNSDTSCNSFNFTSCTLNECTKWMETRTGSRECTQYTLRNVSDWNNCTKSCCDDSLAYLQSWDSVISCQQVIDTRNSEASQKRTIYIVVFAVVLVTFFVVALLLRSCCDCRKRSQPRQTAQNRQSRQNRKNQLQRQQQMENNITSSSHSYAQLDSEWIDAPEPICQKYECSICLEPGLSLELECGHSFHRKCIVESVKRKKECSLCKADAIDNIKVYCEGCRKRYIKTNLINHLEQLSGQLLKCPKCEQQIFIEISQGTQQ